MNLKKVSATCAATALSAAVPMATFATSSTIVNSTLNSQVAGIGLGSADFQSIILAVIQFVLGILGLVVLILIIYAGMMWMTAGGSEEKVQKAQGILKNAVIGLLIIMSSWGIVLYLATVLSGATNTTLIE